MKTQKKGFTLIELMVVIVIIGILAAIAIPKLFGMSAKAKAQEVGPAAGTWSKLQAAYVMETGAVGGSQDISYKLPGKTPTAASSESANFTYYVAQKITESIGKAADATALWTATPLSALGDCTATNTWTATYYKANDTVGAAISDNVNCGALTPNFKNLQ